MRRLRVCDLECGYKGVIEESARLLLAENRRHILWTKQFAVVDEQNHACRTNCHREHENSAQTALLGCKRTLIIDQFHRACGLSIVL